MEGYLYKRSFSHEEIEEIKQDTFLKIHAYRHTFQAKSQVQTWIFSILRNVIHEYLKKSKRQRWQYEHDTENPFHLPKMEVDQYGKVVIHQALQQLSESNQRAILKVKRDGKKTKQAAKEEGMSLSAFKVKVHRAYQIFINKLRDQ